MLMFVTTYSEEHLFLSAQRLTKPFHFLLLLTEKIDVTLLS